MLKPSVVLALSAMAVTPVHAETDWFQLEINTIWCYQNPHQKAEPYAADWSTYATGDDGKTWKASASVDTTISRSRAEYVRDIQIAAARRDPAMAREIYLMCHRHNSNALTYAKAASDAQWVSAVVRAAACYSPDLGANSPRIRHSGQVFHSHYGPITCVD